MQKKILILSGLIYISANPAIAVDNYEVTGENYSYDFHLYNQNESMVIDGEVYQSPFPISKDHLMPLATSAKSWAEVPM